MYDVYVKVLLYKGLISDSKSDNYISKLTVIEWEVLFTAYLELITDAILKILSLSSFSVNLLFSSEKTGKHRKKNPYFTEKLN